jgi:ABC-type uncharacterized transport system ATPase subunit
LQNAAGRSRPAVQEFDCCEFIMTRIALGATEIRKSYGSVRANQGISLSVGPGEIHAIVGENGAGKSTLMRVLQGIERPDSGHVTVMDRDVSFSGPADALAEGIGMVHQEFMLAPDLSLLENLVLGDEPLRWGRGAFALIDWQSAEAQGRGLAERIGIEVDWHRRAGAAPVHIQQPTAVLAPQQVNELFDLVRRIREDGTAILFISHKIGEVMALADRVTVIRQGKIAFAAAVAETSGDEIASHIVDGASPPVARSSAERPVRWFSMWPVCRPRLSRNPIRSTTSRLPCIRARLSDLPVLPEMAKSN